MAAALARANAAAAAGAYDVGGKHPSCLAGSLHETFRGLTWRAAGAADDGAAPALAAV